jgi:hypothetical protein
MTSRPFRNLLCGATLAVLGMFGTSAQATLYDLGWDPLFEGIVRIDLDPACTDLSTTCLVKAISGDFFDSEGREWGVTPDLGTLDPVIISGGALVALDATFGVHLISDSSGCEGESLHFGLDKSVTFHCGGFPDDTASSYTVSRVPEPATLALLGLGLTIAGFAGSRRRKPH